MSTYLTIDLDYWMDDTGTEGSNKFFRKVFALECPMVVVASHESVVRYANKTNCRTLYNVDYHSDIVNTHGFSKLEFCEGTWGNYIKWRAEGTFIWKHPHNPSTLEYGYCHSPQVRRYNPFVKAKYAGWKTVKKSKGLRGIPWNDIAEVCICLSPPWTNVETVCDILITLGREDWLNDDDWPIENWPKPYRI